jgi:hypothetical protein
LLDIHDLGVFQVFTQGPAEIGGLFQGLGFLSGEEEDGFQGQEGDHQVKIWTLGVIEGQFHMVG